MKSDEFSGKMLDDHIEVFCYCNSDYYRNLFWCFVYPYMKKKREASLVSIVYIGIMSVLYLIPQQIGNFLHICWELWLHFL